LTRYTVPQFPVTKIIAFYATGQTTNTRRTMATCHTNPVHILPLIVINLPSTYGLPNGSFPQPSRLNCVFIILPCCRTQSTLSIPCVLSVSKQNTYFLNLLNQVKERASYMRTTSVCDLVSVTKNFCRIFIKFDIGVLYKKLSSKL